jgi:hypothetical protein
MGYETEKQNIPEGFTDLGEDMSKMHGMHAVDAASAAAKNHEEPKVYYPELHFEGENAEHLKDLPENGTATIHFKKVSHSTHHESRHGKKETRHRVGIQIHGLKHHKEDKNVGDKKVSHMTHPSSSHDEAIDKGLDAAAENADAAEGKQS